MKFKLKARDKKTFTFVQEIDHGPVDIDSEVVYKPTPQGEIAPRVLCRIIQKEKEIRMRPVTNIAFGTVDIMKGDFKIVFENHEDVFAEISMKVTAGRLHNEILPKTT